MKFFTGGKLYKHVFCNEKKGEEAHQIKHYIYDFFILDITDKNYMTSDVKIQKNFYQPCYENKRCVECNKKTLHSCNIKVTRLPIILVVRIEDEYESNIKATLKEELIFDSEGINVLKLHLFRIEGPNIKYSYIGGTFNSAKGTNGMHAKAIIPIETNNVKSYYCFNDEHVSSCKFSSFLGHPRLLFYRKIMN